MNELIISFTEKNEKHLYEQIYQHIKTEIVEGRMKKQEKLPSTRALSLYLQVSRSTVSLAYDQLLAEGYIESRPGSGYYVNTLENLYKDTRVKKVAVHPKKEQNPGEKIVFSPVGVDLSQFPYRTWRKITREVLSFEESLFTGGDAQGEYSLRSSIRKYLHAARGVNCTEEQIIIGAGNEYLLMLLQKLLGIHTKVAFENPTYLKAYRSFYDSGFPVKLISMDKKGMKVTQLEASGAQIAYVMPSHQYPTGIVMPIGRRLELLSWADASPERYVIEDDYDSEFRHKGKPIPSLQSTDSGDNVIYIGTFSKAVAPAIRVSYMVLPNSLLQRYRQQGSYLSATVSRVDQRVLDAFMQGGFFERYLNRMRKVYRVKHDRLMSLLKPFEKRFRITGEWAGLHLLLTAKDFVTEKELIEQAATVGVRVFGMSENLVGQDEQIQQKATIILGYAELTEQEMEKGVELLQKVWIGDEKERHNG